MVYWEQCEWLLLTASSTFPQLVGFEQCTYFEMFPNFLCQWKNAQWQLECKICGILLGTGHKYANIKAGPEYSGQCWRSAPNISSMSLPGTSDNVGSVSSALLCQYNITTCRTTQCWTVSWTFWGFGTQNEFPTMIFLQFVFSWDRQVCCWKLELLPASLRRHQNTTISLQWFLFKGGPAA